VNHLLDLNKRQGERRKKLKHVLNLILVSEERPKVLAAAVGLGERNTRSIK
jgi:hypothetical protein